MSVSTQQITPLRQEPAQVRPIEQRKKKTLLLNISIAKRLGFTFLVPALLAALALLRVGTLSQQLLSHEASYYQLLVSGDSSLRNANDTALLLHTNLLGMVSDALKAQPLTETLIQDDAIVEMLSSRFNDSLRNYLQHDVLQRFPDLAALFASAGHGNMVQEQAQLAAQLDTAWQRYLPAQHTSTSEILDRKYLPASYAEYLQVEPAYANVMSALLQLRQFDDGLAPAIQDALTIEENSLLVAAAISALSILLGIGIVGYLVFSTVVGRLTRARRVIQIIEGGQIDARLTVSGRDEISGMCNAVNGMLDTIVGLLEETRQQRDELANAEELKRLHEELQRQHSALNEANARLAALATSDPLTGLANHRTVLSRIEEELSRCKRTQDFCALLFIDLDHFKRINDTYGHRAGDAVLCEAGRRLTTTLRKEDFVGRYGGEEFTVLLVNTDQGEAKQVGERLRVAMAEAPILWQAEDTLAMISIQITGSIGVAIYNEQVQTCAALVEAADGAMYQAKHSGRNRVCFAGEHSELFQEALEDGGLMPDRAALQALLAAIQVFDQQTSLHAMRMMQLAESSAAMLGCSEEEQHLLRLAALMHDVGKIGVPHEILNKPGPLTEDEWDVMRRHPAIGRQILGQAGGQCALLSHIVVAHHERWDGAGYPYGLSGEAIPLSARILAVVDAYDAMTSDRPYRTAFTYAEALDELRHCAGSQFDPQVVTAFLHVLEQQELLPGTAHDALDTAEAGEPQVSVP